ncbi:hypothetical protein L6472_09260 [Prevotella sp. E13-17]|uniref:hypothetical protein n=1 Tax=Prevotella sp. E13-17 TaxID=2913616 RepID=UPI001EDA39CA|nr:hypothetical protein [Prevotella sp. E13-17]UKK50211.1 hypothetical protein L6472_09260 [Prevotella sp. E13-17]
MKKIVVILCVKLYNMFPRSIGWSWTYYHEILDKYVSYAEASEIAWPKWYRFWIRKLGEWMRRRLFNYIKKNKNIAKEYHLAVIKKKNENSKDGTVYV